VAPFVVCLFLCIINEPFSCLYFPNDLGQEFKWEIVHLDSFFVLRIFILRLGFYGFYCCWYYNSILCASLVMISLLSLNLIYVLVIETYPRAHNKGVTSKIAMRRRTKNKI